LQTTKDLPAAGLQLSGPEETIAAATPTLVVGPYAPMRQRRAAAKGASLRDNDQRLDEARGLALAIDLDVREAVHAPIASPRPSTFLGKGKVDELAAEIKERGIGLVVVDAALSPVQQRNLEKAFAAKVIDRTGLILEIFGRRARTREGSLQVELAHLSYQKSRLVRSWTHLERQRGGFGFLGGPGETQIEADRRLIQERMARIEKDLEGVTRTRALHRAGRERVPYPTIALVGYTNAGKSTLFNRLTAADVLAKDMLFATLDPTARAIVLPGGLKAILSDTVGFISDLPTMLVAAFRATLEDVIAADVILHVRDAATEDSAAQAEDVSTILRDLGVDPDEPGRIIDVLNKADQLDPAERERLARLLDDQSEADRPILVSAITGEGVGALQSRIARLLTRDRLRAFVTLPPERGADGHWLYENAEVLHRIDRDDGAAILEIRIAPEKADKLAARFADLEWRS
jgi:GTPase